MFQYMLVQNLPISQNVDIETLFCTYEYCQNSWDYWCQLSKKNIECKSMDTTLFFIVRFFLSCDKRNLTLLSAPIIGKYNYGRQSLVLYHILNLLHTYLYGLYGDFYVAKTSTILDYIYKKTYFKFYRRNSPYNVMSVYLLIFLYFI